MFRHGRADSCLFSVGYMENDPVRGQDSIKSFREALQIAKEEKVSGSGVWLRAFI